MQSAKIRKMTGIAILAAIVVVLQVIASFIQPGGFSIQLVMVPIVIGAAIYGSAAGAILGGVFGIVVLINAINGTDAGANILWAVNPVITAVFCVLKGALAGFAAGVVYTLISKKNMYLGAICAAFISPVVNTGMFLSAMVLFYRDTLTAWAGDSPVLTYLFIGLAGVNFLIELGINMVLAPVLVRIIKLGKKA